MSTSLANLSSRPTALSGAGKLDFSALHFFWLTAYAPSHLAALGPAFSDANNAMVWRETRRLVQEWISTELLSDTSSNTSKIVDGLESMRQLTLHVISGISSNLTYSKSPLMLSRIIPAAAFGMRTHWSAFSDHRIDELTLEGIRSKKESYLLPFHSAMEYTLSTIFVRAGSPNFLYKLPINIPWLSDQLAICTAAFASLKIHMCRLVDGIKNGQAVVEKSREIEDEEHSNDLLRRLVEANEAGIRGGKKGNLSDSELYSNIFVSFKGYFVSHNEFSDLILDAHVGRPRDYCTLNDVCLHLPRPIP